MGWDYYSKQTCPKCDECGKFIPFSDIESGAAKHTVSLRMFGSDGVSEDHEWLCRKHAVSEDGPGEEDGPWAEGWEERSGQTK